MLFLKLSNLLGFLSFFGLHLGPPAVFGAAIILRRLFDAVEESATRRVEECRSAKGIASAFR